ncbi:MAG: hypothetical protein WCZ86_04710 [Desulfurivibrionaceae bacterium]
MKRFKYRMKDGKELWVCESCKKARADTILLGDLKLIGRKDDLAACEQCGASDDPIIGVNSVAASQLY